jgi:hypothetical protein
MDLESVKKSFKSKKQNALSSPDKISIRIHHILMKNYGWIPYEEFMKLPVYVTLDLLDEIEFDAKKEAEEIERIKHKRGKR